MDSEQTEELRRVRSKIAPSVLRFYQARLASAPYFHINELHEFVVRDVQIAPASPDRILRALRQEGRLDYDVINRRASYYLFKTPPVAPDPPMTSWVQGSLFG